MLPVINRILYATDLSDNARLALHYATSLAEHHKASLTMLHVMPDWVELMSEEAGFDIESHFNNETWKNINTTATARALEKAQARIKEMAMESCIDDACCPVASAEIKIELGDPASQILEHITVGDYDLVVMGAHGQGAFMDIMLGSVAHKIVRLSSIPVLTVRLPKEQDVDR